MNSGMGLLFRQQQLLGIVRRNQQLERWASWYESWFSPADPSSGHDEYWFHGRNTQVDDGYYGIVQEIDRLSRRHHFHRDGIRPNFDEDKYIWSDHCLK